MLRFIMRKLSYMRHLATGGEYSQEADPLAARCSGDIEINIRRFREIFKSDNDVKLHEFTPRAVSGSKCAIVYVDGLVDGKFIAESIMRPLMTIEPVVDAEARDAVSVINETIVCVADSDLKENIRDLVNACLSGDTVLFVDGSPLGMIISTKGWEKRAVTEPQSESVIRGPREGFTENLRTNTALLRRRLRTPELRMEHTVIGRDTFTNICYMYIEGIADPRVINEVRARLNKLDVDAILDSGYIEEYIEDAPFSIFPTMGYSEKPDVVCARVLEGRVAIIVDGSPFVLTAPMIFAESFQTSEDYYVRSPYASILRLLRYVGYFISVFAPGLYIAFTTFHQELIPTRLLFTIASAREGTPFPVIIEAFVMIFSFEILREAGLRLPRHVGQAVSIVGAMIMGEASVSAGIVGAPMVITVAITAVASFCVPDQYDSAAILRFIVMIAAAVLGGFGVGMAMVAIHIHLASLSSFGIPYYEGFNLTSDQKDIYIRMPLWKMRSRPKDIAYVNKRRIDMDTSTNASGGSEGNK